MIDTISAVFERKITFLKNRSSPGPFCGDWTNSGSWHNLSESLVDKGSELRKLH
jgi:hypothetical protein